MKRRWEKMAEETESLRRERLGVPEDRNGLGVTLREFIEHEIEALEKLLVERFARRDQALDLQATEYERRLHALNGEYARDRERQQDFVTVEKYEDRMKSESTARVIALERIDEKFSDYVKRYEQRQREVDLLLQAQANSTAEATRATERATQAAKDVSAEAIRKSNRNIAGVGVFLTAVIVGMNLVGVV